MAEGKKVFVVGFVTAGGTGGFEWRTERAPAEAIRTQWLGEGDHDDVSKVREIEVPDLPTRALITAWLDSVPDLWEPKEGER